MGHEYGDGRMQYLPSRSHGALGRRYCSKETAILLEGLTSTEGFDETAGLGEIAGSYVGYLVPALSRSRRFWKGSNSIGLRLHLLGM